MIVAGPALGWLILRVTERVQHVPTAIILQFIGTFGVWMLAERVGLSGVLTTVCCAMAVARTAPERISARTRISTNALWQTVIFALNILAFIFIGLQVRPILESLEAADRGRYFAVAGAVLLTVIVVRFVWHMSFNAVIRRRHRRFGFHPPRPMLRPTVGSGLVISWAGMRGIVTLAAAMALPPAFPYRDLILLTSFSVVLGTLAIQGLTLKPLLRALDLHDEDPVGRELAAARGRALRAALARFAGDRSPIAELFRQEFTARLADERANADPDPAARSVPRNPSRSSESGAASGHRHAWQRRDRGRCVSSNRRGIGLDRDGKRSKGALTSSVRTIAANADRLWGRPQWIGRLWRIGMFCNFQ
ncbi:MAG: hypothetical protein E6H74_14070 [Betaproteobacteria bacterium]|nr:MAG: hypothetical protein E6H74_14070 [Betaproteobacteria bacterium]